MRADIGAGGTFPDYELPDHTSVPRSRSKPARHLIRAPGNPSCSPPRPGARVAFAAS